MTTQRSICFIASDYRFFFRHFHPAIRAARSCGLKITAFLPSEEMDIGPDQQDVRIVLSPIGRNSLTVSNLLRQTAWLVRQLRTERPDIIVVFSVRASLAVALALQFVKVQRAIIYVTGLGLLELMPDWRSRILRSLAYRVLRAVSRYRNCFFIFENRDDPLSIGFREQQPERRTLFVGAGVDEAEFVPTEFPPETPIRVATVSRLVWSKGIDLAAQAVSELAREGYPVQLSIYGAPDAANPRSIDPESFRGLPGVVYKGHSDDIAAVWSHHHSAIFASRGGEGVPRSLLEAAACGRPSIVTDVPGCRDFVRDGVEGYVVAANSTAGLKAALIKLIKRPEVLQSFGRAARMRVLQTSTSQIVQRQYEELFDLDANDTRNTMVGAEDVIQS